MKLLFCWSYRRPYDVRRDCLASVYSCYLEDLPIGARSFEFFLSAFGGRRPLNVYCALRSLDVDAFLVRGAGWLPLPR